MSMSDHVLMTSYLIFVDTEEFCQMEKFSGKCPPDHVLMMKLAQYGRMKLGRCLTREYYVGCTADVLGHMDERCSGQKECLVEIPDPTLFRAQPCPKDLVAYLEAEYTCIKGNYTKDLVAYLEA